MSTWYNILSRKKPLPTLTNDDKDSTQLGRVLTTLDLTFLGVGSTLGVGVYVLAGHVAKETAGPAVVLSFLIAAIASVFAGLCYAEFGARVPKAGSAYIYSYVTVGEFIAFIIGWNLILEYVIGSASVAKALSVYLDTLLDDTLRNTFLEVAPINSTFMSEYFDFFSFGVSIMLGAALAFGLKESSLANNIFTSVNILVVLFVVIAGAVKADPKNWNVQKNSTISNIGEGGFFPFGVEGVIKGAATCFYGFVGFDCIATTGEEVKNPKKAIPISIIMSLMIIFLAYFGTSTVVTLMVPYYLQDANAPIPHAFELVGWSWAKWIVAIGGMFGLCASLFGAMFPLPRIIYAMANDALVFRFLGVVNERFKTPVVGTLLAAVLTGLMSALFNLKQLVNMMSIGTLMAYTIVAACVIILRYTVTAEEIADWHYSLLLQEPDDTDDEYTGHTYEENCTENLNLIPPKQPVTIATIIKQMFSFTTKSPTYLSQKLVAILVFLFCILSLILACLLSYLIQDLTRGELHAVVPTAVTVFFMLVVLIGISAQPTVKDNLSFKVPLVPLIPALSICVNIYLMLMLDTNTWIRFGIWMGVGLPIYFSSCYFYHSVKLTKQPTNGHVNTGYISSTISKLNGRLTIPEITVDPPSTQDGKSDDGSVKNEKIRERQLSIDSYALANAVLELDKVLDESENDYINFEAINPENEYINTGILTKLEDENNFHDQTDNLSSYSSSSGSVHSKEHHIEAQIHQEDSDSECNVAAINETNKQTNKDADNSEPIETVDNQETKIHLSDVDYNNIATINEINKNEDSGTIETIGQTNHEAKTHPEDCNNEAIMNEVNETEDISGLTKATIDTAIETVPTTITNQGNNETSFIPVPPPLQPLLDDLPLNLPHPPTPPSKPKSPLSNITPQNLDSIVLKPIPKRIRTASISSEGPVDNVKPGSMQYNKIKNKLDGIFKNRVLPLPERKFDDKIPSPSVERQLEVIDKVLEQFEEDIPEDFGKTKEFKDELENLLRKKSLDMEKTEYKRKYDQNNYENNGDEQQRYDSNEPNYSNQDIDDNNQYNNDTNQHKSVKTDQNYHKKLMADSLKSIRLRNPGVLEATEDTIPESSMVPTQELENQTDNKIEKDRDKYKRLLNATLRNMFVDNDKSSESLIAKPDTSERDKEKHKRLMNATLRSIQLRKTGLNLEDTNSDR